MVTYDEHFEICSLVGTLASRWGFVFLIGSHAKRKKLFVLKSDILCSGHLHIVLGREDGSSLAGHVVGDYEPDDDDGYYDEDVSGRSQDGVIAKSVVYPGILIQMHPNSISSHDEQFLQIQI